MASSSSFSPPFTVTEEQFKLFHNIDRLLFSRLVHSLRRNPIESMQVIALWIWLEHSKRCHHLVSHMLTWPDTLINALADEAVLILSCIESEEFPFSLGNIEVPLTQNVTNHRVSLRFFRENRLNVLHGVTKNVNEVCARAFEDILIHITGDRAIHNGDTEDLLGEREIIKQPGDYGPVITMPLNFPQYVQGLDHHNLAGQTIHRDVLSNVNEIGEMLRHVQVSVSNSERENKEVPADERTVFLTFSKGYPISENEIRDFFLRKFGGCIEAIHMQEVASTEQPLYARLVMNSDSTMVAVLEGKGKVKFTINGKHVWARKYVRKQRISPPPPSSPSQPPSAPPHT